MRVIRRRTTHIAAAAAAALMLLAGCGGSGTSDGAQVSAGGEVADGAATEGQLTVYGSAGESQMQRLTEAFMKDHPDIQVEYFRAAGTALFNRFSTEAQAGSMVADVFMPTIQPAFVSDHPEWFEKLTDETLPAAKDFPKDFRDEYSLQVAVEEVVAIYNKNATEAPQKWEDVLNPQYKGRIVLVDPKSSPGYMSWYAIMRDKYGDDFLKGLAAQQPSWVDTGATGGQQVAAGSADITFPTYPSHAVALMAQGAPIDMAKNLDPTQGITTNVALTKGSPNPNAAKLFASWLISPAGYAAICSDPVYSATVAGTKCQPLADNFVQPVWDTPETEQNKIVALLGR